MSRFGWCLDGHHDNCPMEFAESGAYKPLACDCDCHNAYKEGQKDG